MREETSRLTYFQYLCRNNFRSSIIGRYFESLNDLRILKIARYFLKVIAITLYRYDILIFTGFSLDSFLKNIMTYIEN